MNVRKGKSGYITDIKVEKNTLLESVKVDIKITLLGSG
jgi:hypothetical protein